MRKTQFVVQHCMLGLDDTPIQSSKFSDALSKHTLSLLCGLGVYARDCLLQLTFLSFVDRNRSFYHGPGGATGSAARSSLTVRDAIAWASFCRTAVHAGQLSAWAAYAHGAYLTLLDGLGLGLGLPEVTAKQLRAACEQFLRLQLPSSEQDTMHSASFKHLPSELGRSDGADDPATPSFGAGAFRVLKVRCSVFARLTFGHRSVATSCAAPVMRDDDRNERAPTDVPSRLGEMAQREAIIHHWESL